MKFASQLILLAALSFFSPLINAAEPERLSSDPFPVVTVKGVSIPDVQDVIIGMMLRAGVSPTKQESNVLVFEQELSGMQAVTVQMLQGNSGWQNPKGRQTFTMAKQGGDVIVTTKYETVATNMLNASNSMAIDNNAMYNEHYLGLLFIAGLAEKRIQLGKHLAIGISEYGKPERKFRKLGVKVIGVQPGSPAALAGIKDGDIVTSINGMPTVGQTKSALGYMGWIQEENVVLNILNKGDIMVKKNPAPAETAE